MEPGVINSADYEYENYIFEREGGANLPNLKKSHVFCSKKIFFAKTYNNDHEADGKKKFSSFHRPSSLRIHFWIFCNLFLFGVFQERIAKRESVKIRPGMFTMHHLECFISLL